MENRDVIQMAFQHGFAVNIHL